MLKVGRTNISKGKNKATRKKKKNEEILETSGKIKIVVNLALSKLYSQLTYFGG